MVDVPTQLTHHHGSLSHSAWCSWAARCCTPSAPAHRSPPGLGIPVGFGDREVKKSGDGWRVVNCKYCRTFAGWEDFSRLNIEKNWNEHVKKGSPRRFIRSVGLLLWVEQSKLDASNEPTGYSVHSRGCSRTIKNPKQLCHTTNTPDSPAILNNKEKETKTCGPIRSIRSIYVSIIVEQGKLV